jgi:predicted 3-demethylubiquinone-9 3-methyltransferase (glyoxalase superfamily)
MPNLIAAEFSKLFSNRLWLWLLLASAGLVAVYVSLNIAFADNTVTLPLDTAPGQQTLFAIAAGARPLVAVLGAIAITTEFRHNTATATFLATPHRGRVVIAKLATATLAGVAYAVACIATVTAIVLPWLAAKGIGVSLTGNGIPRTLAGVVAAYAIFAAIGVALGALIREQVATVGRTADLPVRRRAHRHQHPRPQGLDPLPTRPRRQRTHPDLPDHPRLPHPLARRTRSARIHHRARNRRNPPRCPPGRDLAAKQPRPASSAPATCCEYGLCPIGSTRPRQLLGGAMSSRGRCGLFGREPSEMRKENTMQKITPCLWFDTQAEEAATFYTSIFPNSRILQVVRYGEAGPGPDGSVMTVGFELDGQEFVALNGGPHFAFNEAISFQVSCGTQDEVDEFWSRLSEGGEESQCGWLKDRYGVSWQIIPRQLTELINDPDPETSQRVMRAMLDMKKIDIATLQQATVARRAQLSE